AGEFLDVERQPADVGRDLVDVIAAALRLVARAGGNGDGIAAVAGLADVQVTMGLRADARRGTSDHDSTPPGRVRGRGVNGPACPFLFPATAAGLACSLSRV